MRTNLDLADLQSFVAIAELGSFRAAADMLSISQPALSRRIDKLEGALGARLFNRTTRRVTLTGIGRTFWPKARKVVDDLERSILDIRQLTSQKGEVKIACMTSSVHYFLPRVVRRFQDQHPGVSVRILDVGSTEGLSLVLYEKVDFGVAFVGTQEPEILFKPLLREPYALACRRDHQLAHKNKVRWSELEEHDYMIVSKSNGNRMVIDAALERHPHNLRCAHEVRHIASLLSMVEAGLGVAVVPRMRIPQTEHGTIIGVPLVEPVVTRMLGLVQRKGRKLTSCAQQLYNMIVENHRADSRPVAADGAR